MAHTSRIGLGFACAAVLGLSTTTAAKVHGDRTPAAQKALDKALAGRVPGKPVNCIPNYRGSQMQVVDDRTILFRDGRNVYLQTPKGGCQGLAGGYDTLVTRLYGSSQLCGGEINRMVHLNTGQGGGTCVFGDFVPYMKPKG